MLTSYLQLYRPLRTPDGAGGFATALAAPTALWGGVQIHEPFIWLIYPPGYDIRPEDVIDAGGETYYRVVGLVGSSDAPMRRASLERTERPIVQ